MSKQYSIDMNLSTDKFTPTGGFLMVQVEKTVDPRGFRERSGAEIFALICSAAINGANGKVSYEQLKGFRKVQKMLDEAAANGGILFANKTELDVIKHSIRGNTNWPNTDEILAVLDEILKKIEDAELQ